MKSFSTICSAIALTSIAALAQNVVAPAIFANAEGGTTGNVWRAGTNRVQCFYDSTNFLAQGVGGPIRINSIDFRLGGGLSTAIVNYPSVEIHLQNSAVNYLTPSTTFATNRSTPLGTPNYAGPVDTVAVAGTTPNGYFISIPLTTPFDYDPTTGVDLLMEIVILAVPTPNTGNTISAGFNAAQHLCNSVRSVGSTVAVTGTVSAFAPVANFNYSLVPNAAYVEAIGDGCYYHAASIFEDFAGNANDLSNSTITLIRNTNGGYDALWAPGSTIIPPTGTGLALGDDAASAVITLPFTMNYPSVNSTAMIVDSNGSIGVAGTVGSMTAFTPNDVFSQLNVRVAPAAMDLLPDGATNVRNVFHNVDPGNPGIYLITWSDVPCFGGSGAGSTFQIALIDNGTDDIIEFRYGTVINDSTSQGGQMFTGYCLGAGSTQPAPIDFTVGGSSVAEAFGLGLAVTNRPITGTNWNLVTTDIPAGALLGVTVIGLSDPGIDDLFFLGAPGCGLRASLDAINAFLVTGTTQNWVLPVAATPSLVGIEVYTTSAVNSTENSFGFITSNGVKGTVGSL